MLSHDLAQHRFNFALVNKKSKIMKLAEALSIRKDLQKRIQQIRRRLGDNVKIQEGDEPAENRQSGRSDMAHQPDESENYERGR